MNRKLSSDSVFEVGYGAMPLSHTGRPELDEIKLLFKALEDSPIQIIDTALAYGEMRKKLVTMKN